MEALKGGASANYVHIDEDSIGKTSIPVLFGACKDRNLTLVETLHFSQ